MSKCHFFRIPEQVWFTVSLVIAIAMFNGQAGLIALVLLAVALAFWARRRFRSSTRDPAPSLLQDTQPTTQVYLVIGPYVTHWFASKSYEGKILCQDRNTLFLSAENGVELARHLAWFDSLEEKRHIALFWPFLPDGHDSAALAIASLMSWQKTLHSLKLAEPLPCMFALYARCSQKRFSHDLDRAIWAGEQRWLTAREDVGSALQQLSTLIIPDNSLDGGFVAQRLSVLHLLCQWLEETQLLLTLNATFTGPSVVLSHVLLADCGSGFIRHGAWSRWLEERFGILPALARSRYTPPFPHLSGTALPQSVVVNQPLPPLCPRRFSLTPWLIALIFAGSMVYTHYRENRRSQETSEIIASLNRIPDMQIARKFAVIDKLTAMREPLASCAGHKNFLRWGFSNCQKLLRDVDVQLKKYMPWVLYSSANALSLFASGSAAILPEREHLLEPLLDVVRNNPTITFMIIGYSDSSGDDQRNVLLSQQRARKVRDWIISKTHAEPQRFVLSGKGASFPLGDNSTPKGKEMNRRIEFIPLQPITHNLSESVNKK